MKIPIQLNEKRNQVSGTVYQWSESRENYTNERICP